MALLSYNFYGDMMKGQFLTNIIWLGNNLIYNLKTKGNLLLKQKNPRNLSN